MNLPPVPGSPLPPPPPPPPPPSGGALPTLSRRVKLGLVLSVLTLVALVIVAGLRAPPSGETFRSYLTSELTKQGFEVDNCLVTNLTSADDQVTASLMVYGKRRTVTTYPEVTADSFGQMASQLGPPWSTFDYAEWQRVQQLLKGRSGARLAALAGLEAELAELTSLTFVTEDEVAASPMQLNPTVHAARDGLRWKYTVTDISGNGNFAGGSVKALKDYQGKVCVLNRSEGRDELAALSRRLPDVGARLDRAVAHLMIEQKTTLLGMLQPQALFAGNLEMKSYNKTTQARIFLEITEVRADEDPLRLSALVRNDGCWQETRLFSGVLDYAPAKGNFGLRLIAPYLSRTDAGPLLSNYTEELNTLRDGEGDIELDLTVEDGALTWQSDSSTMRLEPVPEQVRAALIAEVAGEYPKLLAATKVGEAYTGTIINRAKGTRTTWLLRFTKQEENSDSTASGKDLQAVFEHIEKVGWKCELGGRLEANRYRAKGLPVQLGKQYNSRFDPPPEVEIFFESNEGGATKDGDAAIWLKLDGRKLVGENNRFVFRFEPAAPEFVAAFDQREAARVAHLRQIVRSEASHVGKALQPDGVVVPIRLRFKKVNESGNDVQARLELVEQPRVSWDYRGNFRLIDGTLELRASGSGELFDKSDRTSSGWTSAGRGTTLWTSDLKLTVGAESMVGESEYLKGTKLEFPLSK
jgi:hypothetical protein